MRLVNQHHQLQMQISCERSVYRHETTNTVMMLQLEAEKIMKQLLKKCHEAVIEKMQFYIKF